ncbi:MAG: HlyC/CorC family transporter [Lachnospiraceae bacterium]|nr:HlyC/CorC family transporter [Lachnospiraceae bacterium]
MDPYVAAQLICLIILLLLSAFFSSAETAFTTVSLLKMQSKAEEGNRRAKRVLKITENKSKMLSAILIGNNLVNISASSLATTLAISLWGNVGAGIATGILTLLVLIFGEITPKTMATLQAEKLALSYSAPVFIIMKLLTPVIFLVNQLALIVLRLFRIDAKAGNAALTENELRTMINVSHESGEIETASHEVINNIFDFHDSQAKEVMVPRIDMTLVDVNCTYRELLAVYSEDKLTRIPVYEDSPDNIVGIVNIKDLLLVEDREHFSIRDIMRPPFFTYEHKNIAELFLQMREESIAIAIVLDEYGDTAGLITLEDLLEEIVGEIHDEYDDEEEPILQTADFEYQVLGATNLDDVADELHLPIESEDYDSIAGYVFGLLDHLPAVDDEVTDANGIYFKVLDMDKNRINKLLIRIPEVLPDEETEE